MTTVTIYLNTETYIGDLVLAHRMLLCVGWSLSWKKVQTIELAVEYALYNY